MKGLKQKSHFRALPKSLRTHLDPDAGRIPAQKADVTAKRENALSHFTLTGKGDAA